MSGKREERTSLASAAAFITAARTVQMAVVFLLSMPLSRILTHEVYGTYMHVTFLSSVVPVLLAAPLGKLVVYFLPRTERPTWLMRSVAGVILGTGLLAFALIALVPSVLASLDPDDVRLLEHRALIATIIGVSFPYAIGEQVLLARGVRRGWGYVIVAVAFVMFTAIGGALAFAPESERLVWCLRGLLAATTVQAIVVAGGMLLPIAPSGSASASPSLRDLAGFALPVMAASAISLLAIRMDGFAVPLLFGEAAKSSYLRGAMEPPVVGALAFTMLSLSAPEISVLHAGGRRETLLGMWRRTCRMIAVLTVPIVGAVEAVAEDLFLLIYPEKFAESVPVFQWFTAGMLVRIFLPQVLMENTGAAKATTWVAVSNLLLSGTLLAILLPTVGWAGAAPAMVLGTLAANWLLGSWLAARHLDVGIGSLLDWGALLRLLITAGAAWLATHFAMQMDWVDGWGRFARVVAGSAVYSVVFLGASPLTGAITRSDVTTLLGAVSSRFRRD